MKLPVECLNIEKWKAFKGIFPGVEGIHRIIIVHKCNEKLYFFAVTSQIEKAKLRSKNDPSSLVEILPKEWEGVITKVSCLECSKRNLKKIEVSVLKEMYKQSSCEVLGTIPDSIKQKIIVSIFQSLSFTENEKNALTRG